MNQKQLDQLPTWPQRQDSVSAQMADLRIIANRLGLYDAADAIKSLVKQLPELKYGCHIDNHNESHKNVLDSCVIDFDNPDGCIFAKPGMRREQCKYWKIIK